MSRVFQDAADPIIIEDLNGRVVEMNEETVRAYGWSREELLGQSSKTIVPPEQHRQIDELLLRCREGGAVRNVESLRQAKDRRTLPVLMTFTLLTDEEGKPNGIATLAKDITELREVEKRLAELADHERQRLGRELHDSLGQQISGIALLAETLHEQSPAGPQDEVVSKLKNITDEAKNQLRSFIKGLVPVDVDAEGLRVALDELARETTDRHELQCRFECHDEVSLDDNFVATQLFLIAREAVHNGGETLRRERDRDSIAGWRGDPPFSPRRWLRHTRRCGAAEDDGLPHHAPPLQPHRRHVHDRIAPRGRHRGHLLAEKTMTTLSCEHPACRLPTRRTQQARMLGTTM